MDSEIAQDVLFLNRLWDQACYLNYYSNKPYKRTLQHFIDIIINHIGNLTINDYPVVFINKTISSIMVNNNVLNKANCWYSFSGVINNLIWALSSHSNNDFGLFISEWNRVMSLRKQKVHVHHIAYNVNKYERTNFKHYHDDYKYSNFNDIKKSLKHDASLLINSTASNNITITELLILHDIINSDNWDALIKKFANDTVYE